jgi:hypothetical protein
MTICDTGTAALILSSALNENESSGEHPDSDAERPISDTITHPLQRIQSLPWFVIRLANAGP